MGEEAAGQPELLSFVELGLYIGQRLELLPNPGDKDARFPCELVGCLARQSIIIGPPASGALPRFAEGQRIVVRVKLAGGVALFPSTVLHVSEVPALMVYLDCPPSVKFKRMRRALRVDVTLPILVTNHSVGHGASRAGKIIDMSIGGARLEMFESLGNIGDNIELKGKFQVGAIQRVLSIGAVIRARSPVNNQHLYGVEFHECDEEKLLVLMGVIFHAMAFGHVQTIR